MLLVAAQDFYSTILWQCVQILALKDIIINLVTEDYGVLAIEHSHKTQKIIYKIYDINLIFGKSILKSFP